jgi:DNA adenine methylase
VRRTSILRWSGSKAKLLPALGKLAPVSYDQYVEPFAGSASLFFELSPEKGILGDINPCVMDVYRGIQNDAMEVADTLYGIPMTAEAFYTLRGLRPETLSLSQRAARLIFLMKACFNGVYRTNRLGIFNVPMGDKIYALPTRTELLAAQDVLRRTQLFNASYVATVANCSKGDWIYLDPPYRKLGRYRGEYGYGAEFGDSTILELVSVVKGLAEKGCYVTISYSFDEYLLELLQDWHITPITAKRTVAGSSAARGFAKEVIIRNY